MAVGIGAAEQITLTYVSHTGAGLEDPGNQIYRQLFDEFSAEYPDIKVEMFFGGRPQVQVMMAGGLAPDVTFLENWHLPAWQHSGSILPLDPFVERDGYPLEEFFPFMIELSRTKSSQTGMDHLYALPRHPSPLAVYFNRDMYLNAGMETPDQIALDSWTFDRMRDDARRLTQDRTGDGVFDEFGLRAQDFQTVPHTLFPLIRAFGGAVIDDERLVSVLDSAESVEGIQWIADLMWGVQVAPRPGENAAFTSGNVGMFMNIFGQTRSVIANAEFDWDLAYLPAGPAGRFNRSVAGTHVMLSSTNHPDAAWLLLKWLASDRAQALIASGGTALPSRIDTAIRVFDDPGPALEGKNLRVFLDPLTVSGHAEPGLILWEDMQRTVNSALQPVWRGEVSATEAATQASSLLEAILAEERSLRSGTR